MKQLRAFSYSYCDGCRNYRGRRKTHRETFAEREGMLIWPNFIAYKPLTGDNEEFLPQLMRWSACADRQRAGWHTAVQRGG